MLEREARAPPPLSPSAPPLDQVEPPETISGASQASSEHSLRQRYHLHVSLLSTQPMAMPPQRAQNLHVKWEVNSAQLSDDKTSILRVEVKKSVPYSTLFREIFKSQDRGSNAFVIDYPSARRVVGCATCYTRDSPDSSMLDFLLDPELIAGVFAELFIHSRVVRRRLHQLSTSSATVCSHGAPLCGTICLKLVHTSSELLRVYAPCPLLETEQQHRELIGRQVR